MVTKPLLSRSRRSFHNAQPPATRKANATTQRMLDKTNDTVRDRVVRPVSEPVASAVVVWLMAKPPSHRKPPSIRPATTKYRSWDLDLAHLRGGRSPCDIGQPHLQSVSFGRSVHGPPDHLPARATGGQRVPVTKRALNAPEGGEHNAALVRLVPMVR